jgi:hypothetical protein
MPASSNPNHVQQRRFARSKIPQADYQTATDPTQSANIIVVVVKDRNLAKHEVKTEDNKGDATGTNQPTEEYVTEHETTRAYEIRVCFEDIGRDLLDAFGAVAVTQPDAANAPAVKKHTFKPLDISVSKQLPARTLVEIVGAGLNRALPSMVCESLGIKGDGTAHVSASRSDRGSGKVTTPSGIAAADIDAVRQTGLHYVTNSMVRLVISDAGTLANAKTYGAADRLDTWEFNVKNNLLAEQGYVPGDQLYQTAGDPTTGIIRSELLVESQEFDITVHARFASQSDQLAKLRSRAPVDVACTYTGGKIGATNINYSLKIEAVKCRYDMVELDEKDGVMHVQLRFKLFLDTTTNTITSVELVNDISSYTV